MSDEHTEEHGGGEGHGDGGHAHGGGGHGGGHGGGGHAGGAHEEHEGAPEWLISFADNVALMMGFFVILLAMNMQKPAAGGVGGEDKYPSNVKPDPMKEFALAIRAGFNSPVDINSTNPSEQELVQYLREQKKPQGGPTRQSGVDGSKSSVQATKPSDWVKTYGEAFFPEFGVELSEEGKTSMAQAAEQLRGQRWMVEVRGHASAIEAKDNKDRAVRLAHERAYAAAAELVAQGMKWEQIRIVSCADNERETPRAETPEGHRSNQSVQIVTTQEPMPGDPFNGPPGPGEKPATAPDPARKD